MTIAATTLRAAVTGLSLLALASCGGFGLGRATGDAVSQPVRTRGAESVAVNRYLWAASLDVLSFLPVERVDPFTGVIVFGYGRPPGGGTAYRGTVYITDPALDARSLNVALATQGGPVAAETQAAVVDAILTRARQIRIADGRL